MGGQLLAMMTSCARGELKQGLMLAELTLSRPQSLESGLVAKSVLAVLHDKSKARVNALLSLLLDKSQPSEAIKLVKNYA